MKREGKKADLHGAPLSISVCVVICANGSPDSRNNAMNHEWNPLPSISLLVLLTFSNRISPGTLANPLREMFFPIEQQSSSNQV